MRRFAPIRPAALLCCLAVFALVSADRLNAAERIAASRRLPPSVLFYLSCPNVPQAREQFRETSFGRMFWDPALEPFRQHLIERANEESQNLEQNLDSVVLSDLEALLAGDVSLAVVRVQGQPLGVVHFLEIGEHRDLLLSWLNEMQESLGDRIEESRTETIDGSEVTVWSMRPLRQDTEGKFREVAWFIRDGVFVAASGLPTLRTVTARWDGAHASTLETAPVYQEIMSRCQSGPDARPALKWFVDPLGLVTAALSVSPETQLMAVTVAGMAPSLGLNKLRGIGGATELATDRYDSISRTMFYVDQPADGLLAMFEFRPTISSPPEWVPANADHFFAIDWNIRGAYEAVEAKYDGLTGRPGNFRAMINGLAQRPGGGAIDPKNDVVDLLSGLIQSYSAASAAAGEPEVRIWSLKVEDEGRANTLLTSAQRLSNGADGPVIAGARSYSLGAGANARAAVVQNQAIYLATSSTALQESLTAGADSLARSATFTAVRSQIPEQVSMMLYLSGPQLFEAGYEALRSGEYDGLLEGQFDFSLLPPFESLSKYFQPSASYLVPNDRGGMNVWFQLKGDR